MTCPMTRASLSILGPALAAAILLSSPVTQAQQAPTPFPRDGAKQVLDNELVTAWDVTWVPGKGTPLATRRFDQVTVTVSEGTVKTVGPDKTWTIEHHRTGDATFEAKGTSASEEGIGPSTRRAVALELKSYTPPRLNATFLQGITAKNLPGFFREAVKLFETDRVVVWDKTFRAGTGSMHAHYNQFVGVFIEPGTLNGRDRVVGEVHMNGPDAKGEGNVHQEEVQKQLRGIYVEYK
jgi:hypothetical protein